jgi:sugar/nucleoside kinase (ribokinase family)
MKTIVTIGGATQDIFLQQNAKDQLPACAQDHKKYLLLEEGAKLDVADLHYATGGGATNSAISFKKQGFIVSAFFKVGKDSPGEFIVDHLAKAGIDIASHAVSSKAKTGISCILPSLSGNRTIFVYRGANGTLQEQDLPFDIIDNHDCLYITALAGKAAALLPILTTYAKQKTNNKTPKCIATNPGSCQLTPTMIPLLLQALPHVDIFILNAHEARLLASYLASTQKTNTSPQTLQVSTSTPPELLTTFLEDKQVRMSLVDYCARIAAYGPRVVVITNGSEGVYVYTPQKLLFHPSLKLGIASTVGAGDAFGSTFVGSLLQEHTPEQAVIRGIINSAHVVKGMGATSELLTNQELTQKAEALGTHSLNIFPLS